MRLVLSTMVAVALPILSAATLSGPRPPVLKRSTWRVIYPPQAVRKEQEGRVSYVLTIDERGRVTNCVVTASSGHSLLDEAACRTGRGARFEPALDVNGSPTASTWEDTATFDLH